MEIIKIKKQDQPNSKAYDVDGIQVKASQVYWRVAPKITDEMKKDAAQGFLQVANGFDPKALEGGKSVNVSVNGEVLPVKMHAEKPAPPPETIDLDAANVIPEPEVSAIDKIASEEKPKKTRNKRA